MEEKKRWARFRDSHRSEHWSSVGKPQWDAGFLVDSFIQPMVHWGFGAFSGFGALESGWAPWTITIPTIIGRNPKQSTQTTNLPFADLSGQIIATSHDLTPNGGLVREIPFVSTGHHGRLLFTAPTSGVTFGRKGNPLISGKSRLVKYYNLPRFIPFCLVTGIIPLILKDQPLAEQSQCNIIEYVCWTCVFSLRTKKAAGYPTDDDWFKKMQLAC